MDDLNGYLLVMSVVLGILTVKFGPRIFAGCKFVSPKVMLQAMRAAKDNPDQPVRLLDVRTAEEFTGPDGYIQGSVNVPMGDLMIEVKSLAEELDQHKDDPVFVICKTGLRSAKAARVLKKNGFSNVQVLKGGMDAWEGHDLAILRPGMDGR